MTAVWISFNVRLKLEHLGSRERFSEIVSRVINLKSNQLTLTMGFPRNITTGKSKNEYTHSKH